jgi:hypothetical protein
MRSNIKRDRKPLRKKDIDLQMKEKKKKQSVP